MTQYFGPAVGARGQCGFSEEGAWGCQQQTPDTFIELNSDGVKSEIASLVSGARRADRAVHKKKTGVENCGGPIECEVTPTGLETWFKHALGEKQTTRIDNAFVLECLATDETSCVLTITHTAGLATALSIAMTVNSADDITLDLTNGSYDTIGEVMAAINLKASLAAYSPYKAQSSTWQTTLEASYDYCASTDASSRLEELSLVDLIKSPSQMFVVGTTWGVYSHQIQGAATLPAGLSIELGRDIAAFLYSGCKVNTLEVACEYNDFLKATFNFLGKGGTTADIPVAASANTGNEKNAFKIRYTGEQSTATLDIDATNYNLTLDIDGTSEDIVLNINEPYVDPTTGITYCVNKVGGLVEYLNDLSYIDCYIGDYVNPNTDSTSLKDYTTTDITSSTYTWFNFASATVVSVPVLWGDYIGTDGGDSKTITCNIVGAGVPGTATIRFKLDDGSYGSTITTSATIPTEIRIASNVNTGYTIFFPDTTSLAAGDTWTFETIKAAETATYPTQDGYSGFEGSLTIDGTAQEIQSLSFTVNNNLYGEKYHLGERTRAKLPEQKRNVEGAIVTEFDNLDHYRRFVNGTGFAIAIVYTHDEYITDTILGDSVTNYSLTIDFPNVEYSGTTPVNDTDGILLPEFPFTAMYDDTNSIPEIRMTWVTDKAYV